MLVEELLVEVELVLGQERQVVPVDHVVVEVQVDVVDLVDQDNDHHGDEVRWVNVRVAVFHPECGHEQAKGDDVHQDTEDFVELA